MVGATAALLFALPACDTGRPEKGGTAGELRSPARRVVSLMPSTTAIVTALGEERSLVARTSADPVAPALDRLPLVGDPLSPSLETLAATRPDLVLAWSGSSRPALERTLSAGGRVVSFDIRGISDVHAAIALVGELLHREDRADSLIRTLDAELSRARARVPEGGPPPRVAWVVWPDPPTLAGPGSFIDEVLTVAGGRNVVREGEGMWPRLSWERLVARRPDVVVWPEGGGVPGPDRATGRWSSVAAFREGRVIRVPADSAHVPGPWIGRAAERLADELARAR